MAKYTTEQKAEYNKGLARGRRNREFGGGYGETYREMCLHNEQPALYAAWSAGWYKGNDTNTRLDLLKL